MSSNISSYDDRGRTNSTYSSDIRPTHSFKAYDVRNIIDELNQIYHEMEKHDQEYVSLIRPRSISLIEVRKLIS